jgi:hypothetical protein
VRIPFRIQIEEAKMKCSFLLSSIVGATVLLLAGGAWAAPQPLEGLRGSTSPNMVTLVRHGGPMMGMHMHSPGVAGPHVGHPAMLHAYSSPHMHIHHLHHHRRVFVGVPYYDYADSDCWWSRRYHRWICPYY